MRAATLLRVAIIPATTVLGIVTLSFAGPLPFARALQLLLGFVLLVDLATLFKGGLQNACVVLASLTIGLAVVETVLEARMPRIQDTNDKALWERNADFGYRAKRAGVFPAKKVVDGHVAFDVSYTIDDGLRRLTISNPDGPKVRFFGDSYTFGTGLNDSETLPQVFARETKANVLNFGYPGYGPGQALRMLELGTYDEDMKGAKLVILQTGAFHVERTACLPWYTKGFPRYGEKNGDLVLDGRCQPADQPKSGTYKLLVEPKVRAITRADVEIYLKIVARFVDLARSKYGAPVLILDMIYDANELKGTGFTPSEIENRMRAAGAMVLDDGSTASNPELLIPYDGHPTARADRRLARRVIDFLAKAKPDLGLAQTAGAASSPEDRAPNVTGAR